ncbi:MAG: VIT family protein [Bdellovibrio sp.]
MKSKLKKTMAPEAHRSEHIGWLRAAVLGANDGIVSTASLIMGVAAAQSSHQSVMLTGIAGLVAGAMSMAAGEYVSVSSQADTENADLAREKIELATDIEFEKEELAQIYVSRGVEHKLAVQVAEQLMARDALGSHARDELGITEIVSARPIQAALSSAAAFAAGALMPILTVLVSPSDKLLYSVGATTLVCLFILGVIAAKVGGANVLKAAFRVVFWGALAMAITAGVGNVFGANV